MSEPSAKPGPRDGSGPLVWPVLGVCGGLIVYLLGLLFPGVHNGENVITYVIGGAIVGGLVWLLRRRARRR